MFTVENFRDDKIYHVQTHEHAQTLTGLLAESDPGLSGFVWITEYDSEPVQIFPHTDDSPIEWTPGKPL